MHNTDIGLNLFRWLQTLQSHGVETHTLQLMEFSPLTVTFKSCLSGRMFASSNFAPHKMQVGLMIKQPDTAE